jgi:peptidoglycan/LPS O-acetylase OafA/YrhL
MPEIKSHTALRGIAALLVVIFHYKALVKNELDLDAHTHFFSMGYLWVSCFFILSGFILCYVYGTSPAQSKDLAKRFFIARFARIYPLHLATLLFFVAFLVVVPALTHKPPNDIAWSHFWLNIFDIHAWGFLNAYDFNFPSWSISVEFAAYLLFPIVCAGLVYIRRTTIGLLAAIVAVRILWRLVDDSRIDWEYLATLQGLPAFLLGILIFELRGAADHLTPTILTLLQIAAAGLAVMSMHLGMNGAFSILGFAMFVFLTQADKGLLATFLHSYPLQDLGKRSYSIYMLHVPSLVVLQLIMPKIISIPLHLSSARAAEVLAISALVCTFLLAELSFKYFEMPVRHWLAIRWTPTAFSIQKASA